MKVPPLVEKVLFDLSPYELLFSDGSSAGEQELILRAWEWRVTGAGHKLKHPGGGRPARPEGPASHPAGKPSLDPRLLHHQGRILSVSALQETPRGWLSCPVGYSGGGLLKMKRKKFVLPQDVDQVIFGGLLSEPPQVTDSFTGDN